MEETNLLYFEKSSEMLDEKVYWDIIAKSLVNSANEYEQEQNLSTLLGTLTPKEMIGFGLRTDKLLQETYTSHMWCAGYIMNGGCSDDGFEYFRSWIISRGQVIFYKAKDNPDILISEVSADQFEYEFESIRYASSEGFMIKTGKNINDYTDYDEFRLKEGSYPKIEINWSEDNPESMIKLCPQLYKHFNNL